MNRIACSLWALMLGATAAPAQRFVMEDASADPALLTWSNPARWQAGLAYARVSRMVDRAGVETHLRADIVDAEIGLRPWPWLLLYGQAGGSRPQLDAGGREEFSVGAGGGGGARLNLWQLHEGVQTTAWRLTLQLAGQYVYRTGGDDGDGELHWGEALVWLPLDYHLSFARTFRNAYMTEFQSLEVYAGPAFSKVDGTLDRRGADEDFEEADEFGVVGGAELWLLENLAFGARAEWFEDTTLRVLVRYRF